MRILQLDSPSDIKQIMHDIKVDPYGIDIMFPKAIHYLIRMNAVSNITANILKQEMLSLGGDVAVARGALTGKVKKTDCLLMGNLSQFSRLKQKLNEQPFGLNKLSEELSCALNNYQKDKFILGLGKYKLNLSKRPHIMGILNLTPDSFSGDGLYGRKIDEIIGRAQKMVKDGVDILDVGGESSRPGARPVALNEELKRVIPVIRFLVKKIAVPISIDTYKPQVARQALDNGALIVNDITGLTTSVMAKVVAQYKAAVVIMHMKGAPCTMQKNPRYVSLIDEILQYLEKAVNRAQDAGIDKDKIIIDPGIGFGKTVEHNLEILHRLCDFKVLGKPILAGTSRKSFIGKILDSKPRERIFGTVSSCVLAVKNGAKIIRTHDVKEVSEALRVSEAINNI